MYIFVLGDSILLDENSMYVCRGRSGGGGSRAHPPGEILIQLEFHVREEGWGTNRQRSGSKARSITGTSASHGDTLVPADNMTEAQLK